MGLFWDDSAAKAAQAKRDRDADKALARHSGGFLSWGGSGRSETSPGLFGLGGRVARDADQENAKSGYFGFFGARHIASKAREAEARRSAAGRNHWW